MFQTLYLGHAKEWKHTLLRTQEKKKKMLKHTQQQRGEKLLSRDSNNQQGEHSSSSEDTPNSEKKRAWKSKYASKTPYVLTDLFFLWGNLLGPSKRMSFLVDVVYYRMYNAPSRKAIRINLYFSLYLAASFMEISPWATICAVAVFWVENLKFSHRKNFLFVCRLNLFTYLIICL